MYISIVIFILILTIGISILAFIDLLQKRVAEKITVLFAAVILYVVFGFLTTVAYFVKGTFQISNKDVLVGFNGLLFLFLVLEVALRALSNTRTIREGQSGNLSSKFLDELSMQSYGNEFLAEEHIYKQGLLVEAKKFGKIVSVDNNLSQISVRGGLRVTCNQPENFTFKLFLLGGSTIFNAQVPNSLTISSFLQLRMNRESVKCQVVNAGVSGATTINRLNFVVEKELIRERDIVVLYFGINDALLKSQLEIRSDPIDLWIHLLNVCLALGKKRLKCLANIRSFHRPFVVWKAKRYVRHILIPEIKNFEKYCGDSRARFLAILQPSLFSELGLDDHEIEYLARLPSYVKKSLTIINKIVSNELDGSNIFADGRKVFKGAKKPVYADWCHTTADGNLILSEFIFIQLSKHGWI